MRSVRTSDLPPPSMVHQAQHKYRGLWQYRSIREESELAGEDGSARHRPSGEMAVHQIFQRRLHHRGSYSVVVSTMELVPLASDLLGRGNHPLLHYGQPIRRVKIGPLKPSRITGASSESP